MSHLALAAVQLALTPMDLDSEQAFVRCLERAAHEAARACGDAQDHDRLFVFPENTGHFIPLIHAPRLAKRQRTLARAMAALALLRPLPVLRSMWSARRKALGQAVLLAVTPAADALMRRVFAKIARDHRAHVVAGSHLRPVQGSVANTSYTFDPTGRLVAATDKANLVPGLEDASPGGLGLLRGCAQDLPVVHAPWGRLATLICYDGFSRPHTRSEPGFVFMGEHADRLGVDVIANPAANPWPWNERWVFAEHGSGLLRREQWHEEGLPSTLAQLRGVRYGVTAQLCGRVLDFRFEGRSQIIARHDQGIEIISEATSEVAGEVVVARVPAPATRATSKSVATLTRS